MHNLRSDSIHRVSETLVRLASDRHSWHTHSLHLYDRDWWPYHVFSATQWSNWRKPLTSQVPWWFCGYLSWTADGFKVVWLDRQEGFQAYTLEAVTVESVDHFVAYPSMQKPYFAVTLLVSSDFADVHMPQLVSIHKACIQSRSIVIMYEEVPQQWVRRAFNRSHEC